MISFDHNNLPFRLDEHHNLKLKSHNEAFCLDEKQNFFPSESEYNNILRPEEYAFQIDTISTRFIAQHMTAYII